MKLAIHSRPGSFSDRWINYCQDNDIAFKIVNAYENDIINQLSDCDGFLWHYAHGDFRDLQLAKNLLFSLEQGGKKVFPDFNTAWHFDDKVAQKYLLENISAPAIPSYAFYDKSSAIKWADKAKFPKVFKLKGGAGAANVRLIKSRTKARKIISKCFGKGFSQFDRWGYFVDQYGKWRENKLKITDVLRALGRVFISTEFARMRGREKGYAYFQDFLPDNLFDIRVIVVGQRAFALKRLNRKNDFRASGSGSIVYTKNEIDKRCVQIAFDVNKKIRSQSIAYDFVFDENKLPLIVEISFGYAITAYDSCPGYWDIKLGWHDGGFNPQNWMIEDLIHDIRTK